MKKINFNRNWVFYKDKSENRITVNLPHDAMLTEARNSKCANGMNSGFYPGGKYYYEKKLLLPAEDMDKSIWIEFEGIYKDSKIWINGQEVGGRPFGYTNFYIKADPYLRAGEENIIKVLADNEKEPNSRWYSGSGIYRPVYLYIKNRLHVALNGIRIQTISHNPAKIRVDVTAENDALKPESSYLQVAIEKDGITVVKKSEQIYVDANGRTQNSFEFVIPDAKLWCEETPELYQCRVALGEEEEMADFGIRTIHWNARTGLCINGVEIKLKGACIHHDNGMLGAATFAVAEERRVKTLKDAGFNAIRSAHNPISKAMLNACDKYGMYVMDELYDMWLIHKTKFDYATYAKDWWEEDLKDMVDKDYNHPSVVIYSIGNEISETAKPEGIKFGRQLKQRLTSLDGTRPVTTNISLKLNALIKIGMGVYRNEKDLVTEDTKTKVNIEKKSSIDLSGSAFANYLSNKIAHFMDWLSTTSLADMATKDICKEMDIAGYSYGVGRYQKDFMKYPDRIICGSETYISTLPDAWKMMKENHNLIGDFVWTGWDYLGEAGLGAWEYQSLSTQSTGYFKDFPWLFACAGLIDSTGFMTPHAYFSKIIYKDIKKPFIAVSQINHLGEKHSSSSWNFTNALASWTYDGYEGKAATIEIYSAADTVELLLNGKSLGRKKCGEEQRYRTIFETIYQPGILTAKAYDKQGKSVGESNLMTAGEEDRLTVLPEKTRLEADGEDLCYLNIELTDEKGIIKTAVDKIIQLSVSGAGELIALGSARGCTAETFDKTTHYTYHGRALAIIRAGLEAGEIQVKISCDGYEEKQVIIKVG